MQKLIFIEEKDFFDILREFSPEVLEKKSKQRNNSTAFEKRVAILTAFG